MTAPTVFFMFLNMFGTLVLGDRHITTLVFEERITRPHTGVSKKELFMQKSQDGKILYLKTLGTPIDTNLSVTTASGKLYTFRIISGIGPHSIVRIKDGRKDSLYKLVKKYQGIDIEEGNYSLKVTNNSKFNKTINGITLASGSMKYLPKGPSLFIDKVRVYK
jgi:hypothetical protein